MNGLHGLTENSAFYGMIICNVAIIISGLFARSITRLLGTRVTLIISVILCGSINNVLFYPTNYLVYGAFLLNGLGWAVLRVAALAYMTKNSTPRTLSRNNAIHWVMWTIGLILGNSVVMLLNINTEEISDNKRFKIATAMTVICLLGIPGYFFTKYIPSDYEEQLILVRGEEGEITELTPPRPAETGNLESSLIIPNPHFRQESEQSDSRYESIMSEYPGEMRGVLDRVVDMCQVMLRRDTLLLLAPMFAAGVYATSYSPIIPTAVGAKCRPWIVSAFGILVGCGQLVGASITGGVVEKITIRKLSIVTCGLSVLTFSLVALVVQMGFSERWKEWTHFSEVFILILAFLIGTCDMSNNVCLSIAIGRVYRADADAAYSLFVTIMSLSMISWYVLTTLTNSMLYVTLILYSVVSIVTAFSFSYIKFEE